MPLAKCSRAIVGMIGIIALGTSAWAQGEHILVNTLSDLTDFAGAQQVANLPGPDGLISFREAVTAANNTPGPQTIEFAIPVSQFWLFTNMALLQVENLPGGFALTDDGTIIDFTSQTRNIGDTNPGGNEVGIYSLMSNYTLPQPAIAILADNCVIKGLDTVRNFGYGIRIEGNYNQVIGCHLFDPLGGGAVYASVAIRSDSAVSPTGNIIGGTGPGEGNTLACYPGVGLEITGPADGNIVIGNTLTQSHNTGLIIQAGATNTRIGGPTPAERNLIAGNGTGSGEIPQYSDVFMDGVSGTRIEGNYLGTTANGMSAAAPPAIGIEMHGCTNTTIVNNVISGYLFEVLHHGLTPARTGIGVYIATGSGGAPSSSTVIQGNRIGVAADGATPLPNAEGVRADALFPLSMNVLIGGPIASQANTIAHNAGAGVVVTSSGTGVRISSNAIFANGAPDALFPNASPGIDLIGPSGAGGVTPNDPGDADTGGNGLQNFPVLTAAQTSAAGLHVTGTLNSLSSQSFVVELFASAACDPSGFGQGERYIGSTTVVTNASGNAVLDVTLASSVVAGEAITATAAQSNTGNTSEFSACVTVTTGTISGDINGDGHVDLSDLGALLGAYGQCTGDPGFSAAADLDHSGCIDLGDLAMLLANYGR